jgi:hypothetical protein
VMRDIADILDTCRTRLDEIGRPGDDLAPAWRAAGQACDRYDRGARCFRRAARIGVPQEDNVEIRRQGQALDCGFNAWNRGQDLFLRAGDLAQ